MAVKTGKDKFVAFICAGEPESWNEYAFNPKVGTLFECEAWIDGALSLEHLGPLWRYATIAPEENNAKDNERTFQCPGCGFLHDSDSMTILGLCPNCSRGAE